MKPKYYYQLNKNNRTTLDSRKKRYRFSEEMKIEFLNKVLNEDIISIVAKKNDLYIKTSKRIYVFKEYKSIARRDSIFKEFYQVLKEENLSNFKLKKSNHIGLKFLALATAATIYVGGNPLIIIGDKDYNVANVEAGIYALIDDETENFEEIEENDFIPGSISTILEDELNEDNDAIIQDEKVDKLNGVYSSNPEDYNIYNILYDGTGNNYHYIEMEYGQNKDTPKAQEAYTNYIGKINHYANKYFLDPNLVIALATQEKGYHSPDLDPGGSIGIMQIYVSAYPNDYTIPVVVNRNGVPTLEDFTFNVDTYKTLDGNLDAGCAILSHACNTFKGNLGAMLYAYNTGENACWKLLNSYCDKTGLKAYDVLRCFSDTTWVGTDYAKAVFQWIQNPDIITTYAEFDDDGSINLIDTKYTLNIEHAQSKSR